MEKRDKYLLVEGILQLVVLDGVVDLCPIGYIVAHIIIPIDELLVLHVVQVAGDDIQVPVQNAHQEVGLVRAELLYPLFVGHLV